MGRRGRYSWSPGERRPQGREGALSNSDRKRELIQCHMTHLLMI
jgi:hypothetical protein